MSDHLKKRLRDLGDHCSFAPQIYHVAADCIEELEEKVAQWKAGFALADAKWGKVLMERDEAMEALRKIADFSEADPVKYIQGVDAIALDTLAKLEGK
jgi:hypothetical protein